MTAFEEAGLPADTPRAVIPMGIPDPAFFTPTAMPTPRTPCRLLFIGRLVNEKGLSTLLEALHLDLLPPSILRVIGDGPMESAFRQESMSVRNGEVIFNGRLDAEGVKTAIQWSHFVVVPSLVTNRWKEQWGRVAVEAVLSGRPCLVSDSGELPFLLPTETAIFRHGDAPHFAQRLSWLLDDPIRQAELSHLQSNYAAQFQPDLLAADLVEVWGRVRKKK